ncbi:MAG: filamentous hemagglutinin N-terminal domain-containing protein [Kiritimatiellaeota bacterium]|nr:filamentous hemagglutinin N-terminal domain-containing protein [Kiritimatiellota bacterium]
MKTNNYTFTSANGNFRRRPFLKAVTVLVALNMILTAIPAFALDWADSTTRSGSFTAPVNNPGVRTQIRQDGSFGVLDWTEFSIAATERVWFRQDADALAINRVTGANPSDILGRLRADGSLWIVNPNGVFFGAGAIVNVGASFAAIAGDINPLISEADARAGNFEIALGSLGALGTKDGRVINESPNFTIGDAVSFVGAAVQNAGTVNAGGDVLFAAGGSAVVIDSIAGGVVSFVSGPVSDGAIMNAGAVNGGNVIFQGFGIENEGNITALDGLLMEADGDIKLHTGTIDVTGDAKFEAQGAVVQGGFNVITVTDGNLDITSDNSHVWQDGDITVTDGNATISAVNDEFSQYGLLAIEGGNLTINADIIGFDGETSVKKDGAVGGNLTLTAGDSIYEGYYAGNSSLLVEGDAVLTAGNTIDMTLDNDFQGTVSATGDNIALTAKNGIQLDAVQANGDFDVTALNGNITQTANPAAITVGGETTLDATGNIILGNEANDFQDVVNATGVNIALADANDLTLGDVAASGFLAAGAVGDIILVGDVSAGALGAGLATQNGDIEQTVGSSLTVVGNAKLIAADGAGNIMLMQLGNDFQGYVNADGNRVHLYDKDDIKLGDVTANDYLAVVAGDNITLFGAVYAGSLGAGLVSLGGDIEQNSGSLTVVGNTVLNAADGAGDITLMQADNDFQGYVNALGNNVALYDKNDITLGNVTAYGTLDVTAERDITMAGAIRSVGDATLLAGWDIVQEAGSSLRVRRGNLAMDAHRDIAFYGATFLRRGSAWLDAGRDLIFGGSQFDVNRRSLYGDAGRSVYVDTAVNAGRDVRLSARNRNLWLNADLRAGRHVSLLAGTDVRQNADVTAGTSRRWAGTVDVEAGRDVRMAGGTSTVTDGNVRYVAGRNVALGSIEGANARVEATVGNITDANGDTTANITADTAQLVAGGSIGGGGGEQSDNNVRAIDTAVGTLAAVAGNGSVYVQNTGNVSLGTVGEVAVNRVNFDGSRTRIGDGALSGVVADDHAKIKNTGNLTVANLPGNTVDAGGDVLLLTTAGGDITLDGTVSAGNLATVIAAGGITLTANGAIAANSDVYVDAMGGELIMATGSSITSAHGNIRLAAYNIFVNYLEALGGMVNLIAHNNILDANNNDAVNIRANGIRLDAGNNIGAKNNALDIAIVGADVNTPEASGIVAANAGGDITLKAPGDIVIGAFGEMRTDYARFDSGTTTKVDPPMIGITAGGDLTLTAGGTITQTRGGTVTVDGTSDLVAGGHINLGRTVNYLGDWVYADAGKIYLLNGQELRLGNIAARDSAWLETRGGSILVNRVSAGKGVWMRSAWNIFSAHGDLDFAACGGTLGGGVNIVAPSVALWANGNIGNDPDAFSTVAGRAVSPITLDAAQVAASAGGSLTIYGNGGRYGSGDLTIGQVTVSLTDGGVFSDGASGAMVGIYAGDTAHLMADRNIVSLLPKPEVAVTAGRLAFSVGNAAGRPATPIRIDITGKNAVDIWGTRMGASSGGEPVIFGFFSGPASKRPRVAALDCSGAVIFYNGQYMGGAPKYVSRIYGAEAFPSDTPELLSRLGLFSEPFFIHDQIDITQSPTLGFIDHLVPNAVIRETTRELPWEFRETEVIDGGLKPRNTWVFTNTLAKATLPTVVE